MRIAPVAAGAAAAGLAGLLAIACGHNRAATAPLPGAGSPGDDGSGLLARASVKFVTASDEGGFEPEGAPQQPVTPDYGYNGFTYGGFGGDAYGGSPYAGYQPSAPYNAPNRAPDYAINYSTDLGSIEGTITWPKAPRVPATLPGPAGCERMANPSVRLGSGNTVEGAIVYLEKITSGRTYVPAPKPIGTGGSLEIGDCRLEPHVQVFWPLPGALIVANSEPGPETISIMHPGDATSATDVALEVGRTKAVPLTTAGMFELVDKAGKLPPAWLMVATHPYYALTDDHGRFRIDDIVPGDYQLVVWQAPPITGVGENGLQIGEPVVVKKKVTVKKLSASRADVALP